MNYKEFKYKITFQINNLTDQKCIEFGFWICNRLLPEYQNFYNNTNWGNFDKLKGAISFCEKNKLNNFIDEKYLGNLIRQVEEIIPDTENFGDFSGSYALNSGSAVLELLEFMHDKNKSHIFNISEYMTDTIEFKISEKYPELLDEEIEMHSEILNERFKQLEVTK